jgi:thioredoxin reductase (NADPH)
LTYNTEITELQGDEESGLERVRWRNRESGTETTGDIRHLFLFVGADPDTRWLDGSGVNLDRAGFVVTGAPVDGRVVPTLETSVSGVFAIGDVRAGSVKRVGGAIGEGAQVVAALHGYLAVASEGAL